MNLKKAFSIVELLIVMAVIAILVSIAIPSFRAMQTEAWKAKAQGDVRVLKIALESYFKNHGSFPAVANYQTTLLAETPPVLESTLYDPFGASSTTAYSYVVSTSGKYYAVYSVGYGGTGALTVADTGAVATTAGTPIYATNGR
ncbi:MAG: type II secretion system GspH family protein [Candidatus Margulisbacteria bacterium]|jgi:prepilin-type N-terminal cleavage/methylation domain-containing protein|nr:type II secretion system GspH family protein [Candidatus Margulisiibacteriota bacterium]